MDLDVIRQRRPFPNLALMKLSAYHRAKGDQVFFSTSRFSLWISPTLPVSLPGMLDEGMGFLLTLLLVAPALT